MLEYYKDGQRDMSMCGFCVCVCQGVRILLLTNREFHLLHVHVCKSGVGG